MNIFLFCTGTDPCFSISVLKLCHQRIDPRVPPEIVIWYGDPGEGKTVAAFENYDPHRTWIRMVGQSSFMEGWESFMTGAIFDDFGGPRSGVRIQDFMQMIDRHLGTRVEIKGGSAIFMPKWIGITTMYHPAEQWWAYSADTMSTFDALVRRVSKVHILKKGQLRRTIERPDLYRGADPMQNIRRWKEFWSKPRARETYSYPDTNSS